MINPSTQEPREIRLKRLKIRAWRRGTREMDLILGPFADGPLQSLEDGELDAFEALLEENDQDLYAWVARTAPCPAQHDPIMAQIRTHHEIT